MSTEFLKNGVPPAHTIRHPQPAHTHGTDMRAALSSFSLSAMAAGFQPFPAIPMAPVHSQATGVAVPTPILPYPGVPFPPIAIGATPGDLRNVNLCNNLTRPQVAALDANKIKTPINRNYLELAMLVCNTFRGKLFPCPHCRYVTDRRNNLKRHISTMHQACDKVLECCGVSFSTKASLREHIMIFHHNGYSCPYCGRRFCRKALLKRHLSVHSGQKDYTCPHCDYATSHKSNLERHKRIHERLKLGDDGSFFGCTDFSGNPHQSPDTTETSCVDVDSLDDKCVDIDVDTTDDSGTDIDVTDDHYDEDKLASYPLFVPRTTGSMFRSKETVTSAHSGAQHSPERVFHKTESTVTHGACDSTAGCEDGNCCVPLNLRVTPSSSRCWVTFFSSHVWYYHSTTI